MVGSKVSPSSVGRFVGLSVGDKDGFLDGDIVAMVGDGVYDVGESVICVGDDVSAVGA